MVKNMFDKIKNWCVEKYTTTKEKLVKLWNDYKAGENGARGRFNKALLCTVAIGYCVFSTNFLVKLALFALIFIYMVENVLQ